TRLAEPSDVPVATLTASQGVRGRTRPGSRVAISEGEGAASEQLGQVGAREEPARLVDQPLHLAAAMHRHLVGAARTRAIADPVALMLEVVAHRAVGDLVKIGHRRNADAMLAVRDLEAVWNERMLDTRCVVALIEGAQVMQRGVQYRLLAGLRPHMDAEIHRGVQAQRSIMPELRLESHQASH